MASTSIQPFFAPWEIESGRYIDGGYLSNLPILAALERGADEIYALDLTALMAKENWYGVIPILLHEADIVLYHLAQYEIEQARPTLGDRLHHIALTDYDGHSPFDFSMTEAMIRRGEEVMRSYLAEHRTNRDAQGILGSLVLTQLENQDQTPVEALSE
jgi:predicted acylesterase/phospholipase RssA